MERSKILVSVHAIDVSPYFLLFYPSIIWAISSNEILRSICNFKFFLYFQYSFSSSLPAFLADTILITLSLFRKQWQTTRIQSFKLIPRIMKRSSSSDLPRSKNYMMPRSRARGKYRIDAHVMRYFTDKLYIKLNENYMNSGRLRSHSLLKRY